MTSSESVNQRVECGLRIPPFQVGSPYYVSILESVLRDKNVRNKIVDEFYSHFPSNFRRKYGPESHKPLLQAISSVRQSTLKANKAIGQRPENKKRFYQTLKSSLLSSKPRYLNDYIEATYFRAFRTFLNLERQKKRPTESEDESMNCGEDEYNFDDNYNEYDDYGLAMDESCPSDDACPGCSLVKDNCDCENIYNEFCRMNQTLRDLDLLDDLVGDTVETVSRAFIERRVSAMGKSNYSYSYLNELTDWVRNVVQRWIFAIRGLTDQGDTTNISRKLNQYLNDAYAEVRVSHMFEIILEYPNSEAAIQDLRLCLEQSKSSSFRLSLIDSVKQSIVESLLHPGINTYDILTAYISAIKALRALDPSGLILQLVTEPVRRYLKSRGDTVRCIVTALTDEEHNSELNREMIKSSTQTNENGVDGKSSSIEMSIPSEGEKCTATNFEKWKPDPIKLTSNEEVVKTSRFSDIISILVNIYETKDLFVEEYQKLLSQRLLNKYDECNLDTELRNLELLTLRFSDCELHRCEVMLKDVQTSKRVNKRVLSGDIREHKLTNFKDLDVLIVSSPFWPDKFGPVATLYDEVPKITFPKEIQSAINTYTKAFEAIQASRTLHWRYHLGSVNMDITINNKTQNFNVSPLHAALLYMFKSKKMWRIHELIQETSLTAAALRSRLALWQRNGIIRDCGDDKFELITE